ncbi:MULTISPECIES: DUF397 domain-containing protein [Streptomyces]|uniref:DUF397 domain-containing protein n=1 Tax=Streptomyces TaxID=1883 RepID=UPI0002EE2098|nr:MULTISPECIES: DUF397 domain-containing protein [Streptomyces]
MEEVPAASWRRSSRSGQNGGNCLEVADGVRGPVPVRDSKAPEGPVLLVPRRSWAAWVAFLKDA